MSLQFDSLTNHLRRSGHNTSFREADLRSCLSTLSTYDFSSTYDNAENGPFPAIDGPPIKDGWKCTLCTFVTCNVRTAKQHLETEQHTPIPCHIQSISKDKYIIVQYTKPEDRTCTTDEFIKTILDREMSEENRILTIDSTSPADRSAFYQKMQWFEDMNSRVQAYHEIQSTLNSNENNSRSELKQFFDEMYSKIQLAPIALRQQLMRRVDGSVERPFATLETERSKAEYRSIYVDLILFARVKWFSNQQLDFLAMSKALVSEPLSLTSKEELKMVTFLRYKTIYDTNGSLHTAHEVGRIVAKLKFAIRLVTLYHLLSAQGSSTESSTLGWVHRFDFNGQYIYPMHALSDIKSFATHSSMQAVKNSPTLIFSRDFSTVSIGRETFDVEKFRSSAKTLFTMIKENMGTLFGSFSPPNIPTFSDDLSNRSNGYSFISEIPVHIRYSFLRHLLSDRDRYNEGTSNLSIATLRSTLTLIDTISKQFATLIHLISGQPARSTELMCNKLNNLVDCRRNLFWIQDQFLIIQEYLKTRSSTGMDSSIARWLPVDVSAILIQYLVLVSPVRLYLLKYDGQEMPTSDRVKLFQVYNRAMHSDDFLNSFPRIMNECAGFYIGIREYRHLAIALGRRVIISNFSAYSNVLSLFDNQAGHSMSVARNVYGSSNEDVLGCTACDLGKWREVSAQWYGWFGFDQQIENDLHKKRKYNELLGNDKSSEILPKQRDILVSEEPLQVIECTPSCKEENLKRPSKLMGVSLTPSPIDCQYSIIQPQSNPRVEVHDPGFQFKVFKSLQGLFKSDTNQLKHWRSIEQEQACIITCRSERDALIVLPTGSGKSLTFMIPAIMYPTTTSIVVVPTISLAEDLQRRLNDAGITNQNYSKDQSMTFKQILVMTPEVIDTQHAKNYIHHLSTSHKLRSVFIDEAHLVFSWSQFRSAYQQLFELRAVAVPFYFLTATCTDEVRDYLYKQFYPTLGNAQPLEVIADVTRLNIRYSSQETRSCAEANQIIQTTLNGLTTPDARIIVYVQTRDLCDRLANMFHANCYHAGLSEMNRTNAFTSLRDGSQSKIIIATNSFGVGIDYPSVSLVLHVGLPSSILDYAQESGRAGRNENKARSHVLWWATNDMDEKKTALQQLLKSECCTKKAISDCMIGAKGRICISYGQQNTFCSPCTKGIWTSSHVDIPTTSYKHDSFVTTSATAMHNFIVEHEMDARKIKEAMVNLRNRCIVCLFYGYQSSLHSIKNCVQLKNKYGGLCYKCFSANHLREQCSERNRTFRNVHFLCLLPHSVKGSSFHSSPSFENCEGAPDIIRPLMGLIYSTKNCKVQMCKEFGLPEDIQSSRYFDWVFEQNSSKLLNAAHVFLWWYHNKMNK